MLSCNQDRYRNRKNKLWDSKEENSNIFTIRQGNEGKFPKIRKTIEQEVTDKSPMFPIWIDWIFLFIVWKRQKLWQNRGYNQSPKRKLCSTMSPSNPVHLNLPGLLSQTYFLLVRTIIEIGRISEIEGLEWAGHTFRRLK